MPSPASPTRRGQRTATADSAMVIVSPATTSG